MTNNTQNSKPHVGMVAAIYTDSNVLPKECAIPDFGAPNIYELTENCGGDFRQLVEEHKTLFGIIPEKITLDSLHPNKGPPIRVHHNTFQVTIVRKSFP